MNIHPSTDALLVIDVQNDFCPGGALAVPGGDEIAEGIARLAPLFGTVVLSQDWHPAGHASFASSHGRTPGEELDFPYGRQTLWPDHCVQGSRGAEFTDALNASGVVARAHAIVRKGTNPGVDSYSAFFENDKTTTTGLAGYLRERGIRRVVLVGLAYDFCVGYSALDARAQGFEAIVLKDLTRGIGLPRPEGGTTVSDIEARFLTSGVELATSTQLTADSRPRARAGAR